MSFIRAYPPATAASGDAVLIIVRGGEMLVAETGDSVSFPPLTAVPGDTPAHYIGAHGGIDYLAVELEADTDPPEGLTPRALRSLWGRIAEADYTVAAYASQLLYWQRTHRFCAACGNPTVPSESDWSRRCTVCGMTEYPSVSPAILVLIHDGESVLLVHKPGWEARYSIVAGFVEPGESLEECVQREIREETGVEVDDIRYVGSQPWPFPSQLMVSFEARYAGGEIVVDGQELDDARWFRYDTLPELPSAMSLSRRTIDMWAQRCRDRADFSRT